MLRTTCHENPNNIVIVPVNLPLPNSTIPIVGQCDRKIKQCLPVAAQIGAKNVLAEPQCRVISEINCFYSDNIDSSCYFNNVQCSPFDVDTQNETSSCSKYSCHQNLVELTEMSNHNTPNVMTNSSTTTSFMGTLENNTEVLIKDKEKKDKVIKTKNENQDDKYTSPKIKKSSRSINKARDSHVQITNDKVRSFTPPLKVGHKLNHSHKDILKKDIKLDSIQKSVEKQTSRNEPCRSKNKINEENMITKRAQEIKDTIEKMKKRSIEIDEKIYSTKKTIDRKSTIKDRRDASDTCECSPIKRSKLSDNSKEVNKLQQKRETYTIPKISKSKNFTALQRYLAYQRFLRNCDKTQTNDEKNNDETDKITNTSKFIEKPVESVIKSPKNMTLMRTKEQSQEKTLKTDQKHSKDEKKQTSNLYQKEKKKESNQNLASYEDLRKNKGELYTDRSKKKKIKENKEKYKTKTKTHNDRIQTKDQTNENILTYLEQQKNRENTEEKSVVLKSKKKSNKCEGEQTNTEESKKNTNIVVDVLQRPDINKEKPELNKKNRELEEKQSSNLDKKKSNEELDEKTIRRLEKKEKKYKDKLRSLKQKHKLTKISKTKDEEHKIKKKLKSKIMKDFKLRDDVSEKDERGLVSENIQSDKKSGSINREIEERIVNVSKDSSSRIFINKKTIKDEIDLRTVLARNKIKNAKHKHNKVKALKRENLLITVKQNVNNVNTTPKALKIKQIKSKPKLKKSKNIKLVINIKCSNSAVSSDESNISGNESPIQDLSFLDDFDVDEIVDSLNINNTPNHETNIVPKKLMEKNKIDGRNILTTTQEPIEMKSERKLESQELGERCTDERNDDELPDMNKIAKLETDVSNMDAVLPERYDDDLYEVIDITNDAENNIILLEDDATELVANNRQDEQERVCNELENILKTGTSSSDTIIKNQNEVIVVDDDSKDAMQSKTDAVKEDQKINLKNIDDSTFIEIENMLSKITHANTESVSPNHTIKIKSPTESKTALDEHRKCEVVCVENQNSVLATEVKDTNKINIEDPDIFKENVDNKISANEKPTYSLKSTNLDITTMDTTYIKEKQNDADKSLVIKKDESKQSDEMVKPRQKATEAPKPIATALNLITKSDVIKDGNTHDTDKLKTGLNNVAIPKETNKPVEQNNKPLISITVQPTKTETTTKTSQTAQSCAKIKTNDIGNKEVGTNTDKSDSNKENIETDQPTNKENITKIDPKYEPIIRGIEHRMHQCLSEPFTITALIHKGYYSIIYKCTDTTGVPYALKILRSKIQNASIYKDNILNQIQESMPNQHYPILEIINTFRSSGRWCYLTPYYPKTLTEALERNKKSFHIDLVKILSKQLVDAVTILTNNHIVHSDISPKNILLNHTNDRLKLTGFDRANFVAKMNITPKTGTANYRAPEIILGFITDCRIDVWATALVIFEMATGGKLFNGKFNNEILYQQLCTIGPLDYDMLTQSRYTEIHFKDMKFRRFLSKKTWVFVRFSGTNNKLHQDLFTSYNKYWVGESQWQVTKDFDKIEMLHSLLEKMLVLDPRHRLPICFVGASEFYDNYNMFD